VRTSGTGCGPIGEAVSSIRFVGPPPPRLRAAEQRQGDVVGQLGFCEIRESSLAVAGYESLP
jgi:hypothetical protein